MKTSLPLLLSSISAAAASWAGRSPALVNVPALSVRGGANEYEAKFESVKSDVLEKAFKKVGPACC